MVVKPFYRNDFMNSFSYRSSDPHLPDFPTIIALQHYHNHEIESQSLSVSEGSPLIEPTEHLELELQPPHTSPKRFLTLVFIIF